MFRFVLLLAVVSLIHNTNSYVLVQVRKGENESNVDALIHRVVPSGQLDKFTDALKSRKAFSDFKRFEVRQRAEEDAPEPENDGINLGLDTGGSQNVEASTIDGIDRIEKMILNLAKTNKVGGPGMMRATEDYNFRPEVVKIRGVDDKSSVMVKIDSGSIISAVKNLLSSKTVAQYTDKVAQNAAVVYRAIKDEMGHEQKSKNKYF